MSPSRLAKCIIPPNKLVQRLSWKNSSVLLALNITDSQVGVAYATIPRSDDGRIPHGKWERQQSIFESYKVVNQVQRISPIGYMPTNVKRSEICRRVETLRLADDIYELSMDVKAAGVLVAWPLGASGRMGKDCGKILHVLDAIVERPNGATVGPHRPCCLWDFSWKQDGVAFSADPGRTKKKRKLPGANCLVDDKMAKKLIGRSHQDGIGGAPPIKQVKDESDVAASILQEFIHLNWKPSQSQLPRRDAEARMVRNRRLNDTFSIIDEPDRAQLRLLI